MQSLRNAKLFARFVLAWFVLSIGVAIASPIVKPQSMQLVCSASGVVKLQADTGDDDAGALRATLDCPLCAAVGAPPPQVSLQVLAPMGLSYALHHAVTAQPPRRTAAPLPPRGPPASF